MRFILTSSAVFIFTLASCGELERDDNGGPVNLSLMPVNIQNIFTNSCTGCHEGSSAPEGLDLSENHAYDAIVNVNSSEQPGFKRVEPGQPDNSYIIRKIQGTAGIDGDRMPADGPPYLTSAQTDTIRLWITNGAMPR